MERMLQFKKSFSHACNGLRYALRHEKNFQTEIALAFIVIIAMIYFRVTRAEAIILSLIIAGVLVMELFNTVVERVVDILKPRIHPYARLIKDLMAAGVLVVSILAVIVGILIFFPYVTGLFSN
ncbi:MAG TPA: diacylglycerol kinase family protein [Candidatus Moranbacteria bacterium]|nr:diacylglycerol kinase family protein [Candidatus Moranbacteria bacterium]